jgi:hypothetical protein
MEAGIFRPGKRDSKKRLNYFSGFFRPNPVLFRDFDCLVRPG